MNKSQRQDIVIALTAAKKHVWDGTYPGYGHKCVCVAIMWAYTLDNAITAEQYWNACVYIEDLLGEYEDVSDWVLTNMSCTQKSEYDKLGSNGRVHAMQQYRHAWIDCMIADLSR